MMVIYGGRSSDQVHNLGPDYYSNKVSYYNTTTSTWHTPDIRPPLPSGRRSHSALCLDNGKLVIFGGYNGYILKNIKIPISTNDPLHKINIIFQSYIFFIVLAVPKNTKMTYGYLTLTPGPGPH